jgi:hypothetical protein
MSEPFGLLPLAEQKRLNELHLAEAKDRLAKIMEQWKVLRNAEKWDFVESQSLRKKEMEIKQAIEFYKIDLNRVASREQHDAERKNLASYDMLDAEEEEEDNQY